MRLGRRGILTVAAAALAGCAPDTGQQTSSQVPSPSRMGSTVMPATTAPSSSPTASPLRSTSVAPLPTREQVVAEFGSQVPEQWGLEVDGVVLRTASPSICLTFDACGGRNGSGYDEALINTLVETATPATLFLNSRWIESNPQTAADLAANPLFELENHGTSHAPLSVSGRAAYGIDGTATAGEVYDEVARNQALMTSLTRRPPRFFRSGTAHYDDVAVRIVRALGLTPVNFDINADAGATFSASAVRTAAGAATQGSISIAHFNQPGSGTARGFKDAIGDLVHKGATFVHLGDALL